MIDLKIKTKNKSYPILIGNNLMKNLIKIIKKNNLDFNKCLIIIDKKYQRNLLILLNHLCLAKKNYFIFLTQPK